MTSPNPGVFHYQQGGGAATSGSTQFPNGNANINPRSAATGGLLLPQAPLGSVGTPGSPAQMRIAEEQGPGITKNDAIQALLVNSINNPDMTVQLQQQLIQAGYLSPKSRSFIPGSLSENDATFFAVNNLLDDSLRAGIPYDQILQSKIADHPKSAEANYAYYLNKFGADGQGNTAGASVIKNRDTSLATLSNSGDAQAALTQAMRDHLGRAPTSGEVNAFKAALNSLEQSNPVNRQAVIQTDYPGSGGGSGGPSGSYPYPQTYERTATQAGGVNASAEASNYVLGNNQQEADQHSIVGYVNAFESLLKGGG